MSASVSNRGMRERKWHPPPDYYLKRIYVSHNMYIITVSMHILSIPKLEGLRGPFASNRVATEDEPPNQHTKTPPSLASQGDAGSHRCAARSCKLGGAESCVPLPRRRRITRAASPLPRGGGAESCVLSPEAAAQNVTNHTEGNVTGMTLAGLDLDGSV